MAEIISGLRKTGIDEFDKLLNGGIPSGHVVLLAGNSGTGKTVLSMQWLFGGVKRYGERGVYITLTEPVNLIIKNAKTLEFFDQEVIKTASIAFVDLRSAANLFDLGKKELTSEDASKIVDTIVSLVTETKAKRVVIDSITAIVYMLNDKDLVRYFIFKLGATLSKLDCTIIMTSEVTGEAVSVFGVEEFISDGIIKLRRDIIKSEVRKSIQIVKMRAVDFDQNIHPYKISSKGIIMFPDLQVDLDYASYVEKISTGNVVLDKSLHGGVLKSSTTLITGSTGTGKSLLSTQFIHEGLKRNESCLYVGFEESKEQIIRNAQGFGWNLKEFEEKTLMNFRCVYPRKKSLTEHMFEIKELVEKYNIKRCVVDSLSAVANSFSEDDFLSFTIDLNGFLKSKGVTAFFTAATGSLMSSDTLTGNNVSSITDNIIMLRYVEMQGDLRSVINILKVRGSDHSKDLREYKITQKGITIGQSLSGYEGVMTGVTRKTSETVEERLESEFRKFIGPMGADAFEKISNEGISEEAVLSYIDSLAADNVMNLSDSYEFKKRASLIFKGKSIQNMPESNLNKKQSGSFMKRLFGGE